MYKLKRDFLYEVFILRSQRLDNLNYVLFLTVFIKALGMCLVPNYAISFVKQFSSLLNLINKTAYSKIVQENMEKCLISCWCCVPCAGTTLKFPELFCNCSVFEELFHWLDSAHALSLT